MSYIGETKHGRDIGKSPPTQNFVYHACVDCGKMRWVRLLKGMPKTVRCNSCKQRGARSCKWKGGRKKDSLGYVHVPLLPNNFFFPMVVKRHHLVLEHRLIMAKHLGRCLHRWEIVHHLNHIKDDNRIENLQLVSDDRHMQITLLESRIQYLENLLSTYDISF